MMPTFPRSALSFRTAGFPQYGWGAQGSQAPWRSEVDDAGEFARLLDREIGAGLAPARIFAA